MDFKSTLLLLVALTVTVTWAMPGTNRKFEKKVLKLLNSIKDDKTVETLLKKMDNKLEELKKITERLDQIEMRLDYGSDKFAAVIRKELAKKQTWCKGGLYHRLVKDDAGFYLAFRLTTGIGKQAYKKYESDYNDDDVEVFYRTMPCGCLSPNGSLYCDRHFKSALLDMMPRLPVEVVRVAVYEEGVEKLALFFNGTDQDKMSLDKMSFFGSKYLIKSPFIDLESASPNYFSISGDDVTKRRFLINNNYGGCHVDSGWLLVKDGPQSPCPYEDIAGYPRILFSSNNTKVVWSDNTMASNTADVLTVSFKLSEDFACHLN